MGDERPLTYGPIANPYGRWLGLTHRALHWSATTRAMLGHRHGFGQRLLTRVAFYLCIHDVFLLARGRFPRELYAPVQLGYPPASMCPVDLDALHRMAQSMRDEVLHLSDKDDGTRRLGINYDTSGVTHTSTVGRQSRDEAAITEAQIVEALDALDPWLRELFDELYEPEMPDQKRLRMKVDFVMGALAARSADPDSVGEESD